MKVALTATRGTPLNPVDPDFIDGEANRLANIAFASTFEDARRSTT